MAGAQRVLDLHCYESLDTEEESLSDTMVLSDVDESFDADTTAYNYKQQCRSRALWQQLPGCWEHGRYETLASLGSRVEKVRRSARLARKRPDFPDLDVLQDLFVRRGILKPEYRHWRTQSFR